MSVWVWIAIGAAAYTVLTALIFGICRAASSADAADRAIFHRRAIHREAAGRRASQRGRPAA